MARTARVLFGLALLVLAACGEREQGATSTAFAGDAALCVDLDHDGYGRGCEAGGDCDDRDNSIHRGCLNCSQHDEGCACVVGSDPEACYLDMERTPEGEFMCHEGTRYCREGAWSACEELFSYPLPEERRAAALIDPDAGPITCNACNPICFRVTDNLDPVDGGLGGTSNSQVSWNPGGGLTLAEDPDAGTTSVDGGGFDPNCVRGTAPDVDCDGIPDTYDPYPNDPPFATANPTIFLDIAPGQTGVGQIDLSFYLNSADVYFLVDQSASMSDERDRLTNDLVSGNFINNPTYDCADYDFDGQPNNELKTAGIIGAIRCMIRDSNFGVGYFREIPFRNYAANNQVVFGNHQDITSDVAAVQTGVGLLQTVGNNDWPEASMLALNNLITGAGMYFGVEKPGIPPRVDCPSSRWGYPCFRGSAIPIVMLFTDAQMHNGPSNNDYPYNSSYLSMNVGTDAQYVPVSSNNETFGSAYSALDLTNRLVTFTGNTSAMAPDIGKSALSCLRSDNGADAIYSFSLSQQRNVLISTEGSRFDTVLGLFAGTPQTPVSLPPSNNTNETTASASSLGQVSASSVSITGNTSSMVADYAGSTLGCDAATNSPDAVYRFSVGTDANVALRTEGSALDTVIALYDSPPPVEPTFTPHPSNNNDNFSTLTPLGDVYGTARGMSGTTASAVADFTGTDVGCGADSAAKDVVYSFDLAAPTRVKVSTEGSSYDTVIGLVGDTCSGSASSMTAPVSAIEGGGLGTATSGQVHTFFSGSFIIPMDLTYQDNGMFEAYGLVYELLRQNVPVSWVIDKGKAQDGVDFVASAVDYVASTAISGHSYSGGPFVIDSLDVPAAVPVVSAYLAAHPNVKVHVSTVDFVAPVSRQLVAAPRLSLLDDGNLSIPRSYLNAAGIRDSAQDSAWSTSSNDVLSVADVAGLSLLGVLTLGSSDLFDSDGTPLFCHLAAGRWSTSSADGATGRAAVAQVREFLRHPVHLYAQGEAALAFENNSNGRFLTVSDLSAGTSPADTASLHPGLDVSQLVGPIRLGGGYPSFTLQNADDYKDDDATVMTGSTSITTRDDVLVSGYLDAECSLLNDQCDQSGVLGYKKGRVTYAGGQQYSVDLPLSTHPESNGTRLFLNTLLASPCAWDTVAPDVRVQLLGPTDTSTNQVTYTFSYRNDGRGIAYGARLNYPLPAGASLVSVSGAGGLSGSTVVWDLGALSPGETGNVTARVRFNSTGMFDSYATMDYRQGITARRAVSGVLTTDYGGNGTTCTSLGYSEVAVPTSAESTNTAYSLGSVDGRVFNLSGSTSSMSANHSGTLAGCGAASTASDAVVRFHLDNPADVEISGDGTGFDHVLSLYGSSGGSGPVSVAASNAGETTASPQDLGNITGSILTVSGGNTSGMVSNYGPSEFTCAPNTAGSGDAVYRFTLSAPTTVKIDTEGAAFDTVLSLHDGAIQLPSADVSSTMPSSAEAPPSAFALPSSLTGNRHIVTGSTSSMRSDLVMNDLWGPYCHSWSDGGGRDAVVRFTVTTSGTYDLNLASSFRSTLAVYPQSAYPLDVPTVDVGTSGNSTAGAIQLGAMDNWWVRRSGRTTSNFWTDSSCDARVSARDVRYEFSLSQTRTMEISTDGSAIDSVLLLYRWNNAAHTSYSAVTCAEDIGTTCSWFSCRTNDDAMITRSLTAGDYFVVVTGESNAEAGDYQLSIRDTGSSNSLTACDGGSTSNSISRTFSPGTYYAVVKGYDSGDRGHFTLTLTDPARAGSTGNNRLVACNDNATGLGQASSIERSLAAGTYYVVVSGARSTDEGAYALHVQDVNANVAGSQIACDDSTSDGGSLIARNLSAGDYWLMVKGQTALARGAFSVRIADRDARAGVVLACDNDSGDSGTSVIERDLPAGRYFVVVKGDAASDAGAYKLSVRDVGNTGVPALSCDRDGGPGESSYIQARLLAGRTYYAVVKGDAAADRGAYRLTVEDLDSNPIGAMACNDDGGSYKTSKIQQTLNPGTYYVAVKGYDQNASGDYQLTVGGGSTSSQRYVPPTWSQTLSELQARSAKVIPILSCHDDPSHGNGGDCSRLRTQARALATGTETLGPSLAPLVYDIDRDGSGLSRNVVDGIASLANYLEMDVKAVVAFDPDANPGFNVTVEAIDEAGDGCTGLSGGLEHLRCVPGATPKFNVSFENPLGAPVPLNPDDPNGGYTFRAQLIGDDSFLIDEVPIYIIPQAVRPDPDTPTYYSSGEYWQDVASNGCQGTQRPDWRDLGWNAEVPSGTQVQFQACTSEDQATLAACTPKVIATIAGGNACSSDADCAVGFCDVSASACQVVTVGPCASNADCPSTATCQLNQCTYNTQPAYIGGNLASDNFQSYLRMKIVVSGTPPITHPPVLHNWELTYLCVSGE